MVIDGVSSDNYTIDAGVPQGSVLLPMLFLIFNNDLLPLIGNPIYSFADDSTLYHTYSFGSHPSSHVVGSKRELMNRQLKVKILEWGQDNRVLFNA